MQYPKMRRAEKQLSDEEAVKIIKKSKYGVLSLCSESLPYGVPLSHALSGNTIYFHCALDGFKVDMIKSNPSGHFVFVSKAKTLPKEATVDYRSAMAYGSLRLVSDVSERKKAYKAIIEKYMLDYPIDAGKAIQKSDSKTALYAMDIDGLTAKGNTKKGDKKTKKKGSKSANFSDTIDINGHTLKNRIVMPPMVRFDAKRKQNAPSADDIKYYSARAKGGAGLIVVEATAVEKDGLAFKNGLGLWNETQLESFSSLANSIRGYGCIALIQLVYKSVENLSDKKSSSKNKNPKNKTFTEIQVDEIAESFAKAALYAKKAGFNGVELHGCHGFLINQFSCPAINKRTDKYGKSSAFGSEIIKRIRQLCGEDFIISVRTGVDRPHMKNSLKTALDYQDAGADMLSVSKGICSKSYKKPKSWKYSKISYLAYLVKQKVNIPVVGVYGFTNAKKANTVIKKRYFDLIAIGKNHLIHPDWAKRAIKGKKISECRHCSKGCYFFGELKKCPAVEKGKKEGII